MARYKDYEDDDVDMRREDGSFQYSYNHYLGLLKESEFIELFDSIMHTLRMDDSIDSEIRDDVYKRIEMDISDKLIVRPTRSIDE